jgi:hypothetical protein
VFDLAAGQLELGELLVQGMYAAQPDVSSCSQEQLLQLLLLADRYGVPKVITAVSAAFASIPAAQLQWETVHAVYALPAGCFDLLSCQGLFEAICGKLQQEVGDLELVWADPSNTKQRLLLRLPLQAFLQLLSDHRTSVASENTVFYTISQWWIEQEEQRQLGLQEALQLLQYLRVQVRVGVAYTAIVRSAACSAVIQCICQAGMNFTLSLWHQHRCT